MLTNLLESVRVVARSSFPIRKFLAFNLARTPLLKIALLLYGPRLKSSHIVTKALSCPDLVKVIRHPSSGSVSWGGIQQLHHGVKVIASSYYGPEYCVLMQATRGVHEPQEEFVFQTILERISNRVNFVSPHILELGAFWGFYSIWFLKTFTDSDARLVEPDAFNIISGIKNANLNKVHHRATFKRGFVSDTLLEEDEHCPTITIDSFGYHLTSKRITILHCDIQGFEYEMLLGAELAINNNLVEYIFISTHSDDLHQKCLQLLTQLDFICLAEHNVSESYSNDGLIVAAARHIGDTTPIPVSKFVSR